MELRCATRESGTGVAVREYPLNEGFADYLLFVNRKAVGVIEAKKEGTTLSGVCDQLVKEENLYIYDTLIKLPDNTIIYMCRENEQLKQGI